MPPASIGVPTSMPSAPTPNLPFLAAAHDVLPINEERDRIYGILTIDVDRFRSRLVSVTGRGTIFTRLLGPSASSFQLSSPRTRHSLAPYLLWETYSARYQSGKKNAWSFARATPCWESCSNRVGTGSSDETVCTTAIELEDGHKVSSCGYRSRSCFLHPCHTSEKDYVDSSITKRVSASQTDFIPKSIPPPPGIRAV
jgi:hypothetical protein